ncbi:DUF6300 family protein [Streptomyces puniciscabiei]|uniref:DUF6300 family protein n=1 Tax=Streptomyces puniciscabiei TaxID=164348 RepID=UPI00379072F2
MQGRVVNEPAVALRCTPRRLLLPRRQPRRQPRQHQRRRTRRAPPERDEDEQPAWPCSRCGTELLLHWHGALMTGVWMELCPACDAHRPAARAFIQWHRDPKALPKLFEDWESETMHAHGWARAPQPEGPPSPPVPLRLVSRRRG